MPTNFEKIKEMTVDNLAYFLRIKEHRCDFCSKIYEMTKEEIVKEECDPRTCHFYIQKWLESEAK